MHTAQAKLEALVPEDGWPCQRLRAAFGLILFFLFETLVGKHLPELIPLACLGIGAAALVSAYGAIHTWRETAKIALVLRAIEDHGR